MRVLEEVLCAATDPWWHALRDVKLLSFGEDEGGEEETMTFKKKPIVRPDRASHSR